MDGIAADDSHMALAMRNPRYSVILDDDAELLVATSWEPEPRDLAFRIRIEETGAPWTGPDCEMIYLVLGGRHYPGVGGEASANWLGQSRLRLRLEPEEKYGAGLHRLDLGFYNAQLDSQYFNHEGDVYLWSRRRVPVYEVKPDIFVRGKTEEFCVRGWFPIGDGTWLDTDDDLEYVAVTLRKEGEHIPAEVNRILTDDRMNPYCVRALACTAEIPEEAFGLYDVEVAYGDYPYLQFLRFRDAVLVSCVEIQVNNTDNDVDDIVCRRSEHPAGPPARWTTGRI